jgi:hypothetical protein
MLRAAKPLSLFCDYAEFKSLNLEMRRPDSASYALVPRDSLRRRKVSDLPLEFDEDDDEQPLSIDSAREAKDALRTRCKAAGLEFEEINRGGEDGEQSFIKIGMKCGREKKWIYLWSVEEVAKFVRIKFEQYCFIPGYEAVACYEYGTIEASIRPLGSGPSLFPLRRIFSEKDSSGRPSELTEVVLTGSQPGWPVVTLGPPSVQFDTLTGRSWRSRFALTISDAKIDNSEKAIALLQRISNSIFFQIDLLSDVPLTIERDRDRVNQGRRRRRTRSVVDDLSYPMNEYDQAPISLYWYGRSASGMPLLQFLAFYQAIEFYYPTYARAEAQRRIRGILKDPTFRGDRDADLGRLLSAIYVSRAGAYGDERSQLKATLIECVDPQELRDFLSADPSRLDFFTQKSKSGYHKLPINNPNADLRDDVAERIYSIRCKIVHTKTDSRDTEVELLLPFSTDAERLFHDIDLCQYLARQVLISASSRLSSQ